MYDTTDSQPSLNNTLDWYRYTISRGKVHVQNLPEAVKHCTLAYRVKEDDKNVILIQEVIDFRMQVVFSEEVLPLSLDAVVVMATCNGSIQQKMNLTQSKEWTTSFTFNCADNDERFDSESINFDILVDLNPDCVTILKNGTHNVLNSLLNLWENKTLSDVTFKCQGVSITAHANIVISSSPVLAAMFLNDFKEKQEKVVEIPDIKPNVFERLLRYLYTGEAFVKGEDPADEDVEDLFVAADKYAIDSLKEECAVRLSKSLPANMTNVARYLVLAHLHNSPTLHKLTMDFVLEHTKTCICLTTKADWLNMMEHYPEIRSQVEKHLQIAKKEQTDKTKPTVKKVRNRSGVWNITN